jgi:hypothetical protein
MLGLYNVTKKFDVFCNKGPDSLNIPKIAFKKLTEMRGPLVS